MILAVRLRIKYQSPDWSKDNNAADFVARISRWTALTAWSSEQEITGCVKLVTLPPPPKVSVGNSLYVKDQY